MLKGIAIILTLPKKKEKEIMTKKVTDLDGDELYQ